MELRVDPADGLVDELPQIEVSGAAGHEWRSRGEDTGRLFWDMD